MAARQGDLGTVQHLVDNGTNINFEDQSGVSINLKLF